MDIFKPYHNIKIAPKMQYDTSMLYTSLKDKIPNDSKSEVIYKINCKDCNKSYIGQTKRFIRTRTNEHRNDIKNKNTKTGLAHHALMEGHSFDLENPIILDTESHKNKRIFMEMCNIWKNHKNCTNFQNDTEPLSKIYHFLIDKI